MRFIDRKAELNELNTIEKLSSKKLFVLAIYGLRRVGKTRLLLEFLKTGGMYFFVNRNKTSDDLLLEFQEILKTNKALGELENLPSWEKFFEICTTRELPPLVFDEFQNFVEVEPSILGSLQKNIDLHENNPGLIIIAGSLIGLMKKTFQNVKEPLYGRIKRGIRVNPLDMPSCFEIGKELKLEKAELLKLYLIFGGYPKYYVAIEDFDLKGKTALEIIDALFLSKSAPLDEEVNTILSLEFGGRSGIYYSILEAIATGNNRLSSIAGYLNVPVTSITRQIGDLKDNFELIQIEKPYQGKRGIYTIKHPLLEFWFSQIYKNFSDYASRNPDFIFKLKENLNCYYGRAFERAAREFLVAKLNLSKAQKQWGKIPNAEKGKDTYEIDLIGSDNKVSYAFEIKWQDLTYTETLRLLEQLAAKAKFVQRVPANTLFGIVAKKIAEKEKLRAANYLVYDFDDF
ncbi:ATP-binding protein [Candidatus Bathyarchaeota archaeon]|nr:ATP-binding protein [Candidatus Bathyarchaeota archaeon]